jgi:hypothetical protein
MRGILLNEQNDLDIRVKRDENEMITQGLVVGENTVQCAALVLAMNQGDLKEDPIVGANLFRDIRGRVNKDELKNKIETALDRVSIRFEDVKNELAAMINNEQLTINN